MRTVSTPYTIAEIRDQFARRELRVDRTYQRSAKLWPIGAKSYFIDTILNEFVVPPVYFKENLDRVSKRTIRHIVDGQQRLTTIQEFLEDDFALTNVSADYAGRRFSDLEEDTQDKFLSYVINAERITAASTPEILEMFRRINSFTIPLNPAEKRHSGYQGEFKWFVHGLADEYSEMFVEFGVLTKKQVMRMSDAELITEIIELVLSGILHNSPARLSALYAEYDEQFPGKEVVLEKLSATFDYIRQNFAEFAHTSLMKRYNFYSLCAALIHNRWSLAQANEYIDNEASGSFCATAHVDVNAFYALIEAQDEKDIEGDYRSFVRATESSTHRIRQRSIRANWFIWALNG